MRARLAWVYGPGLMLIVFGVAVIFSRYRLSKQRLQEIRSRLMQAREMVARPRGAG